MVVAKQGASITSDPVDSVVYTANNAFGSGTQIGAGNYVVGSGSGPITVTNLNAATQYTFKIYEYNGSGGATNYLTSAGNGNPSSKTTLSAEPTTQVTNVVFTGSTTSTITSNYTNGNGTSRLVVVHAGAPVDSNPVDSVSYTANAAFGSGTQIGTGNFVVKAGPGPVTVTGLSSNTVYYFRVYEFSGATNTTNYNVNTAMGNPAPKTTLETEPTTQATNIYYTNYTASSITLNFTNGNGVSRLVVAHSGAAVNSNPVDSVTYTVNNAFSSGSQIGAGNYVVGSGSGPITVTNLSSNTSYNFRIYEYNGSGGATNYNTNTANGNPSAKTTLNSEPTTQATNVVFTGSTINSITANYTNGNGSSRLVVVHAGAPVDSNPVDSVSYTANAAFGSGTQIGTGNFVVKAGAGPVTVTGLSSNTVYYFRVYEFNGSTNTTNYNGNTATGNPAPKYTLAPSPTTNSSSIAFSGTTQTQTTLTWTSGDGTNRIVLAHDNATIDSNPVDTVSYTADPTFGNGSQIGTGNYVVYNGSSNTVTVTGLSSGEKYYFQVFDYNGSGSATNYLTTSASGNPNNVTMASAATTTISAGPGTEPASFSFHNYIAGCSRAQF